MSEPEKSLQNFLQRWSRRKLAVAERTAETPDASAEETHGAQPNARADALPESAAAAFDPASLPPIESIKAATDIRAFLAPGVPIDIARAALRRAWVSDPAIRDFIGLAENQWDFTQPDAVPGFGRLDLTPELLRMLAGLYSEAPASDARSSNVHSDGARTNEDCGEKAPSDHASTLLPDSRPANPVVAEPQAIPRTGDNNAAVQNVFVADEPGQGPVRRKHGSALPE